MEKKKSKIDLLKARLALYSMYGVIGASILGGHGTTAKESIVEPIETITEESAEETTEEIKKEDMIDYIVRRYNSIYCEHLTREDIGKIEVGQANLFVEDGQYVFDPSIKYDLPENQIEKERTKGIITYINRNTKKAITSIGYIDGNLNDIYVRKYFDNETGYIESDKTDYIFNYDESQFVPEVDEYNNVVTYVKKQ